MMDESIEENPMADFYSMGGDLQGLKVIGGIAQMVFATIVFFVNRYFFEVDIVSYAAIAMFGFGFFILGVKNQTLISPSRKLIRVTKGFFFIVFTNEYGKGDIDKIQITQKTHRGDDSSGIGPTREDVLITTYYVQLLLRNTNTITINSSRERSDMVSFGKRVANAMNVPMTNE